jgi:hypothetical protein
MNKLGLGIEADMSNGVMKPVVGGMAETRAYLFRATAAPPDKAHADVTTNGETNGTTTGTMTARRTDQRSITAWRAATRAPQHG